MVTKEEIEQLLTDIVEKVKTERKKRNISQLKLATILGFQSPNYVAKIETRKDNASYNITHLYIISKEFDMELFEFFT
jgi:transcriptional regulator with XRE-family HTH domain